MAAGHEEIFAALGESLKDKANAKDKRKVDNENRVIDMAQMKLDRRRGQKDTVAHAVSLPELSEPFTPPAKCTTYGRAA
jgi:hypothetical protein